MEIPKLCSHVVVVAETKGCLDDFLTSYRRSKIIGNYTAVSMHNQPKNVGKKPSCPKRKAPSQYEKPEIDTYVDPLSGIMTSGNGDVSQTTALSKPRYSPSNSVLSLANSVTPTALATLSLQLHAIPSQPTASVSSSQICQLNLHPQNVTSSFQCSPLPLMHGSFTRNKAPNCSCQSAFSS